MSTIQNTPTQRRTHVHVRTRLSADNAARLLCRSPIAAAVATSITLALLAPAVYAQSAPALPSVTITGSPVIEANVVDVFGSAHTSVGEEQIRDLNAIDLSSALRRSTGVAVSRFNPVGSFGGDEGGAVYVRGMGASRPGNELRTYVDGIPFYMGVWNHALLDLLPVNGVREVSVFKGPQPQLYGDTFAAIDMAPRRATRNGLSGNASVSVGSWSTLVEQAAVGWRSEQADVLVSQGHAKSDGHRPDADGKLDNAMVNANVRLGDQWSIGLLGLSAYNKVSDPGIDGIPTSKTGVFTTRGGLVALSLQHDHAMAHGRLQVYGNSGLGLWDNPTAAQVRSTFELSGLRWSETLTPWQGGEVLAGLDVDRSTGTVAFNGFTAYPGETLRLVQPHVAVAHKAALGGDWSVTPSAGVRLYDHNVFADTSAPHVGVVVEQGNTLALRLNHAKGVSYPGQGAPLLNAIVPPLAGTPTGWRSLGAETMQHTEVGLRYSPGKTTVVDLAVFDDQLKNRYVIAFPPAVAAPSLTNLGEYGVKGVEATWQQTWSPALSSYVGVTLLDASRADLPYIPEQAGSLGVTWRQGSWRVSVDAQAQCGMLTLNRGRGAGDTNTAAVGGFGVVNLRTAYQLPMLGAGSEAFVAMENLGDRAYAYRPGYPMPGRSAQLGVSFKL